MVKYEQEGIDGAAGSDVAGVEVRKCRPSLVPCMEPIVATGGGHGERIHHPMGALGEHNESSDSLFDFVLTYCRFNYFITTRTQ